MSRSTYETTQPWVIYHYGRTHDRWWPFWSSTRVLGRACVIAECAVCGDRAELWFRIPRVGKIVDRGHHPKRVAYLADHAHPDRPHPMAWAKPLLNWAAHDGGIDLDLLAMRLQGDVNEGGSDA